jgi:uncharacterized protein
MGNPDIMEMLLNLGAQVDAQDAGGSTARMYAAFNGRENAVALLLKRGASKALKDHSGETASVIAAKRNFTSLAKLLQ